MYLIACDAVVYCMFRDAKILGEGDSCIPYSCLIIDGVELPIEALGKSLAE